MAAGLGGIWHYLVSLLGSSPLDIIIITVPDLIAFWLLVATFSCLLDLNNVFESFLPQLLSYPNPIDPLNGDAAALYLHKPEDYKAKIRGL